MSFELHENLKIKNFVIDLPLCTVLLEDNRHYQWLFLVPRRQNISRIMDLQPEDQLLLLKELDMAQKVLWKLFSPTQINVAAIGNKTPQLHVHVIARYASDPAWPSTTWDHPAKQPYDDNQRDHLICMLAEAFLGA